MMRTTTTKTTTTTTRAAATTAASAVAPPPTATNAFLAEYLLGQGALSKSAAELKVVICTSSPSCFAVSMTTMTPTMTMTTVTTTTTTIIIMIITTTMTTSTKSDNEQIVAVVAEDELSAPTLMNVHIAASYMHEYHLIGIRDEMRPRLIHTRIHQNALL